MKAYRGYRDMTPLILKLLPRWRRVVSFQPRQLYLQQINLGPTKQMGPTAGLDVVNEKKISCP
jgi:hypothetical protein